MSTRTAELRRPAFRPNFAFRFAWNDFLWPLIAVNKPDPFPLPAVPASLRGAYGGVTMSPALVQAGCIACGILHEPSRGWSWAISINSIGAQDRIRWPVEGPDPGDSRTGIGAKA
jgi:hypothetical protein